MKLIVYTLLAAGAGVVLCQIYVGAVIVWKSRKKKGTK